jgi:hypothetical protein
MDQVLDYDAGARAAKVNFLVGYDIAQEDAAPAWNKGDFLTPLPVAYAAGQNQETSQRSLRLHRPAKPEFTGSDGSQPP